MEDEDLSACRTILAAQAFLDDPGRRGTEEMVTQLGGAGCDECEIAQAGQDRARSGIGNTGRVIEAERARGHK